MTFTLEAAKELGIPEILFWTISACGFLGFMHYSKLIEKALTPLKEKPECPEWLDTKDSNSVVYANFGSITVMTPDQLVEFAWGLANSKQTLLWNIRPDIVSGDSNSTLESISNGVPNGVPMICWPFFAEQQTNCWYCCTKWDIGLEIDNNVKRDEVESLVRDLIVGEKGKNMKKKAMEWKKKYEEAANSSGGSSISNMEK
ncbi:hypothetical protein ACH5RR_034597, partial [Cinchona calisaya]